MVRPRCNPNIDFCPPYKCFQPLGGKNLDVVTITTEEAEALRLKNIENLDQTQAAERMGISQSTFQRILSGAYKKVTEALIEGKELRITDKQE